jgi:hypothetical protein
MSSAVIEGRSRRARSAALVALAGLVAAPRPAPAQPVSPSASAVAAVLFEEGRRLLQKGKIDEACAKLGESQRLEPLSGTLLNLAACHEKQGKIATAWAEFGLVEQSSTIRGNESRAAEAKRRAADLAPKLSFLTITVAKGADAVAVKRDGLPVEPVQFGVRVPVDPGEHVVSAEAEGRLPFRRSVQIKPGGESVVLEVPALAPAPPKPAAPPPTAPASPAAEAPPPAAGGKPVLGYVAGGVGVVALGAGAFFGLQAASAYQSAKDACPTRQACPSDAIDDREQAGRNAWLANVGVGVGLVGLAAGAYLLFIAPPKPAKSAGAAVAPARVSVGPAFGASGATFALRF